MKKYIPQKMIENSRFCTFFKTLSEDEKQQLITKIDRLVEENSEYADDKNYAHLCNLLASLALVMILEENGKTRDEARKTVADAMYEYINPQIASMEKLAGHGFYIVAQAMS